MEIKSAKKVKFDLLSGLHTANSCWQTSKSWQSRAFTRQTRVKSQDTLIYNMADVVTQWH